MNAFMPMMGNSYLGGNVVRPTGVIPTPAPITAQPAQPTQVQTVKKPTIYYCVMVDSYQDITSAGLPLDGTPVMFMLNSSPQLYIAYMQGEKKYICGYKIESMDIEKESPTQEETSPPQETLAPVPNPLENRIAELEKFMGELKTLLTTAKGGNNNESNPSAPKTPSPSTGKSKK
jgi:hypothetical protein